MTQTTVNRTIPGTELSIFPLSLGGNVFGWTADEATSFEILDAYVAGGGNFIDTADVYSLWAPDHIGGESEVIIGKWLAARGNRADIVVATKVSSHPDAKGLSRASIRRGVEASLQRLGTDYIDLYYAHQDDSSVEISETVGAFGELVAEGKVRALAASNFSAERLAESLKVADEQSVPRYVAVQPHYNLVHRDEFEGAQQDVVARENLATVPYSALASGFLTGKYRTGAADGQSPRAEGAAKYLNERGLKVLAVLDQVAAEQNATVSSVALAWLAAQPTVIAPIAIASKVAQVESLLASAHLTLTDLQLNALTAASA